MAKIILLDGNSLSYRAFYATPPLKNKKGLYTNSVYGFTLMLEKILENVKPDFALVAFDKGKKTFRHKEYKEYKGTRNKTPIELIEQFDYIRELLDSFGIKYEEHDEYEADDIIGTYAKIAESMGHEVIIVSGDRDLTQLATNNITIYFTKKGVTELDYYTPAFIKEKYNIEPLQIIDMKGLMGDKSDNIPGIAGIGEKTAIKLLSEYQTIENILENTENIKGTKLKEKIINGKQDALLSKKLATIFTKVPINNEINNLTFKENINKKIELFEKLEFTSFLKKMKIETTQNTETKKEIIEANEKTKLKLDNSSIYLECYTEDYQKSDCLGVAVYQNNKNYIFSEDDFFNNEFVRQFLISNKEKNIYDFKKFLFRANKYNIEINGEIFDSRIANYLIDVNVSDDISKIIYNYLEKIVPTNEEIYGKGAKRTLPNKEILHNYLTTLANYNVQLKDKLIKLLEERELTYLYKNIEIETTKVLIDMELEGIAVSKEELNNIKKDLDERIKNIETTVYELSGKTFNISSPKQLGEILFEKLKLPAIKKTKTGYSTSAEVLEFLIDKHEIIPYIMEYRTLTKLNSTYAIGLTKDIGTDGKIHTRYEQTLAQTGRLSSINPNLQNIPVKIEDGKKIRKAFIPSKKDYIILSVDYSQIELRVLADIANDSVMIEAFNNNEDIHTKTASQVNNVPLDKVSEAMRREAKAVNFGIVYGISDFGLSNNLGISRNRAKEFIEKYLQTFDGVKKYMDNIVQFAKENGYVKTLYNRRRELPEINSKNKIIVNLNSRIAMNTPIQGTAADIIKIAMIKINKFLKKSSLQAKMLLQVHDELIFEVHKNDLDRLKKEVIHIMENSADLKVKLKVEASSGKNWYEAK